MQRKHLVLLVTTLSLISLGTGVRAQEGEIFNRPGTVHLSLGFAPGVHAVDYRKTYVHEVGPGSVDYGTRGVITFSVPLQVNVGIAEVFSLGVFGEPANYVDFDASQTNELLAFGIVPKLYMVNTDRVGLSLDLQGGVTMLNVADHNDRYVTEAEYRGYNFGIGIGATFLFGGKAGMHIRSKIVAHRLELDDHTSHGIDPFFSLDQELRTVGGQFEVGGSIRF